MSDNRYSVNLSPGLSCKRIRCFFNHLTYISLPSTPLIACFIHAVGIANQTGLAPLDGLPKDPCQPGLLSLTAVLTLVAPPPSIALIETTLTLHWKPGYAAPVTRLYKVAVLSSDRFTFVAFH
jgi:hypothetical protein